MKEFDVLVAGEINPDLILSGNAEPRFGQAEKIIESAELTIGSSSVIFACGAARLGLRVAFIGKCGKDIFGDFMLEEMKAHNINVENVIVDKKGQTGLSVILNRGQDRAILTQPGLISSLSANEIPDALLEKCRHLHVAAYFLQTALQPGLSRLFSKAHSLGLTTSLDTNYDPTEKWAGLDELLNVTDIFLPNETEACSITALRDVREAGGKIARLAKIVAIKRGAEGAIAICAGEVSELPSQPVQVIDTVGAGDSFDAGFVFGYLQGWPLKKTLKAAIFCGSASTCGVGGTSTQASLAEVMRELS